MQHSQSHRGQARLRVMVRLVVVLAAAGVVLAACERDKGDPAKISEQFIVGVWTGDVELVNSLTCKEWRHVTTDWAAEGDPNQEIDITHTTFDVVSEGDSIAEVEMSGMVTFKAQTGEVEVRNLNEMGGGHFTLVDESGWKVCDAR
ncbi:MAG: hypothetical protein JW966_11100 [Anaerolineae bacterium]|nr:hypothetical protein [Anaerolineae bacterium]